MQDLGVFEMIEEVMHRDIGPVNLGGVRILLAGQDVITVQPAPVYTGPVRVKTSLRGVTEGLPGEVGALPRRKFERVGCKGIGPRAIAKRPLRRGLKGDEPRSPERRNDQLPAVNAHGARRAGAPVNEGIHVHLNADFDARYGKCIFAKENDGDVVDDTAHRMMHPVEIIKVAHELKMAKAARPAGDAVRNINALREPVDI